MRALAARAARAKDAEAGLLHRVGGAEMFLQAAFVQRAHPESCRLVVDRPETHDHCSRAGDLKCPPEAEYALARFHFSEASVARRENRPLDTAQIQCRDLF